MYKLLKWAYELGQKQENRRIRLALVESKQRLLVDIMDYENRLRNEGIAPDTVDTLKTNLGIAHRALSIIGDLIDPRYNNGGFKLPPHIKLPEKD